MSGNVHGVGRTPSVLATSPPKFPYDLEKIWTVKLLPRVTVRILAAPLAQLAKKPKYTIFAVTMADIEKALAPKKHTDPAIKVPVCHHKHLDIFSRKEADKLAEHRLYDYKIILEEGKQPGFKPLYGMS